MFFFDRGSYFSRLSGFLYTDVLHIYGLSRAGYIPQLFSIRLPNPVVIYELLQRAGAKALVYDVSFSNILEGCPVPSHLAADARDFQMEERLPPMLDVTEDDIGFIFHTSGSTSGSPKLVPCRYRWLKNVIEKSYSICHPRNPHRQDVTVFMFVNLFITPSSTFFRDLIGFPLNSGSLCHIAQSFSELKSWIHSL